MMFGAPRVVLAADSVSVATDAVHVAADAVRVTPAAPVVHVMNFEQVSPALMRGGAPSAQALKELKAAGVKTIVNLRGEGGASKKEERNAKEIGLDYYNIPMGYTEPSLAKVSSVLDIMRDPAKQPVYLHCMHGADRTGMMVGINRILSDGWQFDKVYSEMRGHHFKPFLIPMRRTVQAFANGKYTYVERQGVSIAGVSPKSPRAKMAAEKPL
ncbi:MAG: hypothetical protein DKT66_16845 [Candidatus Melainabacteria bacterium]|nr:MAG: hypothetical protein DKT66_16845 [Candidatus Melainabacteria bacterium]